MLTLRQAITDKCFCCLHLCTFRWMCCALLVSNNYIIMVRAVTSVMAVVEVAISTSFPSPLPQS